MELNKNIKHQFDLSSMNIDDKFLGCTKCWYQLEPNAASIPICPICNNRLSLLYVRNEDILNRGKSPIETGRKQLLAIAIDCLEGQRKSHD